MDGGNIGRGGRRRDKGHYNDDTMVVARKKTRGSTIRGKLKLKKRINLTYSVTNKFITEENPPIIEENPYLKDGGVGLRGGRGGTLPKGVAASGLSFAFKP